jgi:hypothetical protein
MLIQLVREKDSGFHSLFLFILHLSLQYLTSFQTLSHFLRHENGLKQTGQILLGKFLFFVEEFDLSICFDFIRFRCNSFLVYVLANKIHPQQKSLFRAFFLPAPVTIYH